MPAVVAPSAIPFLDAENAPLALDDAGLDRIRTAFADATVRSARLGIDAVQLHAAHGYLLHQFLSPLSNRRDDSYGGSLESRMRFPLEIFVAVRAAFGGPVTVRVSGTDWVDGGWTIEETIAFARALEARGCAAINVSSGGLHPAQQIALSPGYQVPLARRVKDAVAMPVIAVGLITDAAQAGAIVANGDADMVAIARAVIGLAHNLGLKVIAEGIEHAEQLDRLRALNCEYGQGNHFSVPLNAHAMGDWLGATDDDIPDAIPAD